MALPEAGKGRGQRAAGAGGTAPRPAAALHPPTTPHSASSWLIARSMKVWLPRILPPPPCTKSGIQSPHDISPSAVSGHLSSSLGERISGAFIAPRCLRCIPNAREEKESGGLLKFVASCSKLQKFFFCFGQPAGLLTCGGTREGLLEHQRPVFLARRAEVYPPWGSIPHKRGQR